MKQECTGASNVEAIVTLNHRILSSVRCITFIIMQLHVIKISCNSILWNSEIPHDLKPVLKYIIVNAHTWLLLAGTLWISKAATLNAPMGDMVCALQRIHINSIAMYKLRHADIVTWKRFPHYWPFVMDPPLIWCHCDVIFETDKAAQVWIDIVFLRMR